MDFSMITQIKYKTGQCGENNDKKLIKRNL